MGTRMRLVAHGGRAPLALAEAEALVHRLDGLLSRFRPDSDVSALARRAGEWVAVDPHTDAALRAAARLADRTGGVCDPVLGAIVDLWAPARHGAVPAPSDDEVARALARCGHALLERRPGDGPPCYRLAPGAGVDLGAVGKGYAATQVADLLRRHGVTSALVACGASSIAAVGGRPDGGPWRVGLRAPLDAAGPAGGRPAGVAGSAGGRPAGVAGSAGGPRRGAVVPLRDEHLSVSGDDVPPGGLGVPSGSCGLRALGARPPSHVLDPRTGRPAASDLRSAAVVTPDGVVAEALSTAMLVLGREGALALCAAFGPTADGPTADGLAADGPADAVLVTVDGRLLTGPGVQVRERT